MQKKSRLNFFYLKDLRAPAANILKQDALSIGAELACNEGVILGRDDTNAVLIANDRQIEVLAQKEALQDFGLNPTNLKSCVLPKSSFHSYIELHIEQGPVLQRRGIPVGIVTGIAAPVRYELRIEGRADHSGATPMDMRCDALTCASEIVLSAERIAKEGKTTVATTGYANAIPGVLNVIPGSCTLGLDIRDIDEDALRAADDKICAAIDEICARRGCKFELKNLIKDRPVKLSEEMIDLLESCAGELKIPSLRLPSGAGHDAMNMTELAGRVGMLFVPCKDGISHNVNESINWHDAFAATKVLAAAMLNLAKK